VLRLAAGPVSWGVDFADCASNPPWQEVVDGISAAGVRHIELGPYGYLPTDAEIARRELARRELAPVGSFVFDEIHRAECREAIVSAARRTCRWLRALGASVLVVIDRPSAKRAATAGDAAAAERLPATAWAGAMVTLEAIASSARRLGIRPVLHPHAGSYVEFADEIETAMCDTTLDLCIDTGHLLYAGLDPADIIDRYAERVAHVHLKDLNPPALSRTQDFWQSVAAGAFCALGDGGLDLPRVTGALHRIGYDGVATIEQDRREGTAGSPAGDLRRSVERVAAHAA